MDQELDARLTAIEKTLQVLGRELRDVATQLRWFNDNAEVGKKLMEGLLGDATAMAHLRTMLPGTAAPMPTPVVEPPTEEELAKMVAELPPMPENWSACCGGGFPPARRAAGALSPDEIRDILKQHGEG